MKIGCVWEHNGEDSLLYAQDLPGAYSRGCSLGEAMDKMPNEVRVYLSWAGEEIPDDMEIVVVQDVSCDLTVRDADSDVLFDAERYPLSREEYERLKTLALRSASCFQELYDAISDKEYSADPIRKTFYGYAPRTAGEMYRHTRSVNAYYFGEIGVDADNEGTILECRVRGFETLEHIPGFLDMVPAEGSYGEWWSVRKVLRRFIWHDRIHAKAMFRMAKRNALADGMTDPFCFEAMK